MNEPTPGQQPARERGDRQQSVKLGLALSGGGFRASIFHLGVLARLAELGLLRQVQVLSTVSGGSIIGAFYYLHARRLLQENSLDALTEQEIDAAYIATLQTVVRDFRVMVRRNARAHLLLNPFKNLRMAVPGFRFQHWGLNVGIPYYSRTDRVGDLLDRYLYKQAWGQPRKRRRLPFLDQQIELRQITIQPKDAAPGFKPEKDNAGRKLAKVPILLLNASSLNTGHNWRFEAIGMGEPLPEDPLMLSVFDDVQGNQLLAEGYFEGAHSLDRRQQEFPLAMAVAASAAVPGIFHPLSITGMYRGWRPQVVDGGLHDNQGVQGLFDKSCTHMVISDASAQMADIPKPETRIPRVLFRSMSVYGSRVREEELARAEERRQWTPPKGQIDVTGIVLLHLRKGLTPRQVPPVDEHAHSVPGFARPGDASDQDFGVDPIVQRELANVRTDLDVFSDAEFYALMYDGYTMADHYLSSDPAFQTLLSQPPQSRDTSAWGPALARVELLIRQGHTRPVLFDRALAASNQRFFRFLPTLIPQRTLRIARLVLLALLLAAAVAACIVWHHEIAACFRTRWPIWWMSLALGAPLVALLLYVQPTSFPPLRIASTTVTLLVVLILAVPAALISALMRLETPLLLRLGRLPP